jgi:AsmA protein
MRLHRFISRRFSMSHRRRRIALRLLVIVLAVVVLVPLAAAVGALVFVNPNVWRPEIEAAAQRSTGRALSLGRLSLIPSLSPTIGVADLALANLPDGSRPQMVTVSRAEVKLALLPLLVGRVEIARLVLIHPDILLEYDRAGRPNWQFGTPTTATSPAAPTAAHSPEVLVRALRIEDGTLTWRGRNAAPIRIDLHLLEAGASGLQAPLTLNARGGFNGEAIAASVETGSLARLFDTTATTPWPIKATIETPGARLAIDGSLTHPMAASGETLSIDGAAVNLSALDGLLGFRLPPLRQVAFTARVVDTGGALPAVSELALHAGASDLDAYVPGLKLDHAEVSAAALNEPVRLDVAGSLSATPLHVTASLGPLADLLPGQASPPPYPVELAAEAQGATLAVRGSIANPAGLGGVDLAVTGRIPDLSALSPLLGTTLPALRPVTLDARVTNRATPAGYAVRGLAVTSPAADLSGEMAIGLGPRPSLQATLTSRRIDLDAIMAALQAAAPPPAAAASPAPPPAPSPPPSQPGRLIPDEKLPFGVLDTADADVRLTVGELLSGGVSYRDLSGRLSLADGRLALDPFSANGPGGRMDLKLSVNARATPPPLAVSLHAPGMPLKPLLAALHQPNDITGNADIQADLHSAGDTPRALAAALDGQLGLAMANGELDNRLLGPTLGRVLHAVPQFASEAAGLGGGRTPIRCLAIRADANNGIVRLSTLTLDTGRMLLNGTGTLDLRDEGIQLRLRPTLRAGIPIVIPTRVGGTFLAPKVEPDAGGAVGGLASGVRNPLGALSSALAGERGGDACGPALAAARGAAQSSAAPAAASASALSPPPPALSAPPAKAPNAAAVLRGLLSR